jgi:hypothetical protein
MTICFSFEKMFKIAIRMNGITCYAQDVKSIMETMKKKLKKGIKCWAILGLNVAFILVTLLKEIQRMSSKNQSSFVLLILISYVSGESSQGHSLRYLAFVFFQ